MNNVKNVFFGHKLNQISTKLRLHILQEFSTLKGSFPNQMSVKINQNSKSLLSEGFRKSKIGKGCFLLNYISVITSMFINKFVQKCQYYYTLSDLSVPLVTVTAVV